MAGVLKLFFFFYAKEPKQRTKTGCKIVMLNRASGNAASSFGFISSKKRACGRFLMLSIERVRKVPLFHQIVLGRSAVSGYFKYDNIKYELKTCDLEELDFFRIEYVKEFRTFCFSVVFFFCLCR